MANFFRQISSLQKLSTDGTTILLLDHKRKRQAGENKDDERQPLGSVRKIATARAGFEIKKLDDETRILQMTKDNLRIGFTAVAFIQESSDDEKAIIFKEVPLPDKSVNEEKTKLAQAQALIMESLKKRPMKGQELKAIVLHKGIKERTYERALSRYVKSGIVKSDGRGGRDGNTYILGDMAGFPSNPHEIKGTNTANKSANDDDGDITEIEEDDDDENIAKSNGGNGGINGDISHGLNTEDEPNSANPPRVAILLTDKEEKICAELHSFGWSEKAIDGVKLRMEQGDKFSTPTAMAIYVEPANGADGQWAEECDFFHSKFKKHDMVQWESLGVFQFVSPRRIERIEYDKGTGEFYYFVEGGTTGIPEDQLRSICL